MPSSQSPEAQAERLDNGRCLIHGILMTQIGSWYEPIDGRAQYTIVGCPRRDCDQQAKSPRSEPLELVPMSFAYPDPPGALFEALELWVADDPARQDAVLQWIRRRRESLLAGADPRQPRAWS